MAGRAAAIRACLHTAVRHGGPATFHRLAGPPESRAVHAISVAPAATSTALPLRALDDPEGSHGAPHLVGHRPWSFVGAGASGDPRAQVSASASGDSGASRHLLLRPCFTSLRVHRGLVRLRSQSCGRDESSLPRLRGSAESDRRRLQCGPAGYARAMWRPASWDDLTVTLGTISEKRLTSTSSVSHRPCSPLGSRRL